ncbi:hypothetical protein CVV38_03610 [Candidatus Peregrinibacteria bacterium HGW-Peregrinibacteria-1]|jgi:thymidine kinase|nr:MAG: hypothetical protein CVV38_03610 [Candidatus Peregrinibacteria bacterium HGW-Peregrinibacteria-1]
MIVPSLTVFTGPMRSGKTTALIEKMLRYRDKNVKTIHFKHRIDNRFEGLEDRIVTHGKVLAIEAVAVENIEDIVMKNLIPADVKVVAIDEGHFFGSKIVDVCRYLRITGHEVYVSGLNRDYTGEPFKFSDEKDHFGALLAVADFVKMFAACPVEGAAIEPHENWPISMTRRRSGIQGGRVVVGADDVYETSTALMHPEELKFREIY